MAGSILIFNAYGCKADCDACISACLASTVSVNPVCSMCMQSCVNISGCSHTAADNAKAAGCVNLK